MKMRPIAIGIALLALISVLAGCASTTPEKVRQAPEPDLGLEEVRADSVRFQGAAVRWGGVIVKTENLPDVTRVELVYRPLTRGGRPLETDRSSGRFVAMVPAFLDPVVYAAGRELTVHGKIQDMQAGQIGQMAYDFVVVAADTVYLWPEPVPLRYEPWPYFPGYYGPFYDPWYRFHPRPWPYY